MDDAVRDVARRTAKAMETSGVPGLRLQVEETIAAEKAGQLNDTVALAGLIVSAAGFAWKVGWDLYLELRKRKKEDVDNELRESIERAVKEELESHEIADQMTEPLLIKATTDAVLARIAISSQRL
jgi:hypothetical protein